MSEEEMCEIQVSKELYHRLETGAKERGISIDQFLHLIAEAAEKKEH